MDTEKLIEEIKRIDSDFTIHDIQPHSLIVRNTVQMFTSGNLQNFLYLKAAFGIFFYVTTDPITNKLEGVFFENGEL